MHPAPSVIVFTVLSGLGFGLLAHLALLPRAGVVPWALGFALAVGGLVASTFHLARPERAWRAFSQWRTSWLSREGVVALAALAVLAPVAAADVLGMGVRGLALPGAALAVLAVFCTAMIYAQLRAVPRWNSALTPLLFLAFALAGGAVLSAAAWAVPALLLLGAVQVAAFRRGDGAFARAGQTLGTATGLSGRLSVFERPHTGETWLTREMIHVVGRRHAAKLRVIAVACAAVLPALVLSLVGGWVAVALAAGLHLVGALAARWLFFAEAEHVVGLYYGRAT